MANPNLPPEPDDHQLSSLPIHIRPIFGEYYGDPRYTVNQIAAEFGVTRPTIYRHLKPTS